MAPRDTCRQIAGERRRLIDRGELPSGAMEASESVLTELVGEGLVGHVRGRGRRVVGDVPAVPSTADERLAGDLLRRIESGEFGPAEALPSDATLVADHGALCHTVRRAHHWRAEAVAVRPIRAEIDARVRGLPITPLPKPAA